MTRIVVRPSLPLLLALILLPACSTTTQRSVAAISFCVASLAVEAAISIGAGC